MVEDDLQESDIEAESWPITRRRLLAAGSTAGALALAGCGGGSSDDGTTSTGSNETTAAGTESATTETGTSPATATDPETGTETESNSSTGTAGQAAFGNLSLSGPENASVDESFNLSLSVTNTGGENGTFNGTLGVTGGSQNQSENGSQQVEISEVAPNETATTDIGPFNFSTAANYTISMEEREVSHSVAAEPITLDLGESYTFGNGLETTVESARFQSAIFYDRNSGGGGSSEDAQTGLFQAESNQILMVARLSLENTGSDEATFTTEEPPSSTGSGSGPVSLYPAEGAIITSGSDVNLGATQNIEGEPLNNAALPAGEQRSGWLLAQVPREAASGTVSLVHQRDGPDSPPEVSWQIPPSQGSTRSLPQFTLDSFEMPSPREISNGAAYTVNVTNEGDGSGTFRGLLAVGGGSNGTPRSLRTFSTTIEPGSSKTFEGTHPRPYLATRTYQLAPFGESATVETAAATRSYGATYTTPLEQEVAVLEPMPTDQVTFAGGLDQSPDEGNQLVPVPVEVRSTGEYEEPPTDLYTLRANGQTYKPTQVQFQFSEYAEPLTGRKYQRIDASSGQQVTGVLLFETPSGLTASDLSVELRYEGDESPLPYAAVWGESGSGSTSTSATSAGNTTQG